MQTMNPGTNPGADPIATPGSDDRIPLVVDLDGSLVRSDLLVESFFAWIGVSLWRLLRVPVLLTRGKAPLKAAIASETRIDAANLPYDERVLDLIASARERGQPVHIASASHASFVEAIAGHHNAAGWLASDGTTNLASKAKASALVERFGQGGFDYVGNDRHDIPVWRSARRRYVVNPSPGLLRAIGPRDDTWQSFDHQPVSAKTWLKLLRAHQWAKNLLIFVPLLTAHVFDLAAVVRSVAAMVAFCFTASAFYIYNDMVDIEADRSHPTKSRRPFAAGTVPILPAAGLAFLLAVLGLAIGFFIGPAFLAVLCAYVLLTVTYSSWLKRKMFIDIIVLAGLYIVRVLAGATAIDVPVSEWLLGFSLFIFVALALIKRYVELATRVDGGLPDASNRNYRNADLPIVGGLAAAAGFNAVTVFELYLASPEVRILYTRPELLWLICPILLYWIGRAIFLAHRRLMHDDPIFFAVKDRNSYLAFGLIAAIMLMAA